MQQSRFDYVELPTKSREGHKKAKSFYSSVFGWSYTDWGDDYSDTKDSGISSGLNADSSNASQYPFAVIYVQEIEAVKKEIIAAGGQITRDIFSFPGGRRFHFTDPNGNELGIWSDK
jgi:predicted enzyme related to lactoylglutathione lyase